MWLSRSDSCLSIIFPNVWLRIKQVNVSLSSVRSGSRLHRGRCRGEDPAVQTSACFRAAAAALDCLRRAAGRGPHWGRHRRSDMRRMRSLSSLGEMSWKFLSGRYGESWSNIVKERNFRVSFIISYCTGNSGASFKEENKIFLSHNSSLLQQSALFSDSHADFLKQTNIRAGDLSVNIIFQHTSDIYIVVLMENLNFFGSI